MTSGRITPLGTARRLALPLAQRLDRHFMEPAAVAALNQALATFLDRGGLDELQGRTVRVVLSGTGWSLALTLKGRRLFRADAVDAETELAVTPMDAARLICRVEDPDTLFFRRRLRIEGDVELGLYLKNSLDALDEQLLPRWARQLMDVARDRFLTESH